MGVKLEVGKTYEVRDPIEAKRRKYPSNVTITFESERWTLYRFGGDNLFMYDSSGRWNSKRGPLDLVKEVHLAK